MRKTLIGGVIGAFSLVALVACGSPQPAVDVEGGAPSTEVAEGASHIAHRYATAAEGRDLLAANDAYYAGFSQNDIDFRTKGADVTIDELRAFDEEQVLDFTDDERAVLDGLFADVERTVDECGYALPPLDEITLVKTTMAGEPGVLGYTHGTEIHLAQAFFDDEEQEQREVLYHELFHCLTRCNPDFRAAMYALIHFTIADHDFALPPRVAEYFISNPDVEHHDAWATFVIDGRGVDCFCAFVTTRHFEPQDKSFFDCAETALVPIDGSDTYYTPEETSNFDEVFGKNTGYVVDPEECMADNFSYALAFGMDGPDGKGYPTPEIIEGIIDYLRR